MRERLTVREAADRVGVGYSTMKRWIRTGSVRTTTTTGGHHRISQSEVERLLARRGSAQMTRPQSALGSDGLAGLSARNRLPGYVEEVRVDGLLAQVRLRVGDITITAVVTTDAVRALRLKRGDPAVAIVKSTEVMIGIAR